MFQNRRHTVVEQPRRGDFRRSVGFTLIELLLVVLILSIAAAVVVPMASSAGSIQIRAAVNMVAADLEYAKSMAISRGQTYRVVFDVVNESYQVEEVSTSTVVTHPVTKKPYVVNFGADQRLDQVNIVSASFDGTSGVIFDYLGSPYDLTAGALNSGVVTLQGGGATRTVSVEPVTGFISVSD
jgi:prepilin-type N-terminal cleavage/methylation domain-containing protein